MEKKWLKILGRSLSYVLVAAVAAALALVLWGERNTKYKELETIIDNYFVGQADMDKVRDAAAGAMIDALGDRWSYYIPADEMAAYEENKKNAYVGVGITISVREDGQGLDIIEVAPGGSAQEGGILPGDVLVEVEGQSIIGMTTGEVKTMVQGEEGTSVSVGILRNGEKKNFSLERRTIKVAVATGQLLNDGIGYVRIVNFNAGCAEETLKIVEDLQSQGAKKLIFDVRNNPGGYVHEMIDVLDFLLPEGVLFREVNYRGMENTRQSDASCLKVPMAVLVNGDSYSAAEFFAAALQEYDWATVVGQPTTGKGHYQNTLPLSDGSAVNLSTGKYFTPNGVNLTETGGIVPDVPVEVDEEIAALIYSQMISAEEDPQIQAAVQSLLETDR